MSKAPFMKGFLAFMAEEDAATAIEYAVMVGLIVGVCVVSVEYLASKTEESFNASADAIINGTGS
ncbi:Flp/Fap pilin component [Planctomycetes bacterium CA13]|uniref:Flp/Fap pilin component n=1 Tax=Novipirellula herctigrandis TaxID=2527986 RepID=A0A5C5Z918_9BACT|nr:Flp/Fap pilin component [Planctomycetes bacterium CA13]